MRWWSIASVALVACATSKPAPPPEQPPRRWYPECVGQRADGTLVKHLDGAYAGDRPLCGAEPRVGGTEIVMDEPPGTGVSFLGCAAPFSMIRGEVERDGKTLRISGSEAGRTYRFALEMHTDCVGSGALTLGGPDGEQVIPIMVHQHVYPTIN